MNVLLVGAGGREYALALKLKESRGLSKLYIADGNAGTERFAVNVPIAPSNVNSLSDFACEKNIELVVVGPELPLSLGLVDMIQTKAAAHNKRIACFGPSQKAARLESSKAFAKNLMSELGIPTAAYASFTDMSAAAGYVKKAPYPVVIKASGLASGKGVFLPATTDEAIGILYRLFEQKALGSAADEIIIEERLYGEEVSLMAFCDGHDIALMPSAQDHKRLLDNDEGPNTGGMGAYAPAPICPPEMAETIADITMRPIIKKLNDMGSPFVGVLYAGIILSAAGPKVLEYNARLGDPETEAVLPLLESDLLETMLACTQGTVGSAPPRWKKASCAAIVMASSGYPEGVYPETELVPQELSDTPDGVHVMHAATKMKNGKLYAAGGRVLCVTASAPTLADAADSAYAKLRLISFHGAQYRSDIARRGIALEQVSSNVSAYSASGVDIDAGNKAVALMKEAVCSTYTPSVLSDVGSFGGLFSLAETRAMKKPVLVASTDGVGTKVKLAALAGSYSSVGMDIVNHCIDDILVQGARPLFFLDYYASSKLRPEQVADVVNGISEACRVSGCALLGGETAEMPNVYMHGEFDIAGTIVGVVEEENILPKKNIAAGDLLIGLASDSPHTNGYSLIRKAFEGTALDTVYPELGRPLSDVLLTPHRSYLNALYPILQNAPHVIKALAHITGGGFIENIPRVVPKGLIAAVDVNAWNPPPLYPLIQKRTNTARDEMYRVFNMGIAMIAIVAPENEAAFRSAVKKNTGEDVFVIGRIEHGARADSAPCTVLRRK